jgi:putative phage-type endonuclease
MAMRSQGIGGSEAAAALGVSRWKTPLRLFKEKRKEIEPEDISTDQNVYFGLKLEPLLFAEYTERTGIRLRKRHMMKSRKYPWMVATIDRMPIGVPDLILEGKTINAFAFKGSEYGPDGSDKIPLDYYCQCQHNMIVANRQVCDMPVLIGGSDFRIYRIARHEAFCKKLISAEARFWAAVRDGHPEPPPMNVDDILMMFPQPVPDKIVEANITSWKAHQTLMRHRKHIEHHEAIAERAAFKMKKQMKDAEVLQFNGVTLATWRQSGKSRRFVPKEIEPEKKQPSTPNSEAQIG